MVESKVGIPLQWPPWYPPSFACVEPYHPDNMAATNSGLLLLWPPCYIDQAKQTTWGGGGEKSLFHSPSTTPTLPNKNTFSFPGFLFFATKKREPVNKVGYKTTLRLGSWYGHFPPMQLVAARFVFCVPWYQLYHALLKYVRESWV